MQRDQEIPQCAQVKPGSSGNIRKAGVQGIKMTTLTVYHKQPEKPDTVLPQELILQHEQKTHIFYP